MVNPNFIGDFLKTYICHLGYGVWEIYHFVIMHLI